MSNPKVLADVTDLPPEGATLKRLAELNGEPPWEYEIPAPDCLPPEGIDLIGAVVMGGARFEREHGADPDGLPAGLTVSEDRALLNWRGENYVRQVGESRTCRTCGYCYREYKTAFRATYYECGFGDGKTLGENVGRLYHSGCEHWTKAVEA